MQSPNKKFENGTEVYWEDPEGVSSGNYSVVECCLEDGENSVYLISNDFSEAEVLYCELKEI